MPTTLLHVSADDLEQLVATHSAFSRALLRLEAQRLHVLLAALE
jgi:CRP-like cAMP-binding protein